MTGIRTTQKGAIDRFWDQFIERAKKNGVKQTAVRWYVLRAEQYLKAFPEKRLAAHSTEDVNGYLEMAGRIDRILDWQFVQTVDAIQNLLLTAGAPVAEKVDWAYWRDSARTLSSDHPTIAREGEGPNNEPVSGARFKECRSCWAMRMYRRR